MNEPRNKQQDIARLSFLLRDKAFVVFLMKRQFRKVVSMVSNLLVFSFASYPSPFSHFESSIVCDCLSLNTFHFACDNAEDNAMERNTFSVEEKENAECSFC
jgi:hypothetical protein